ncbi:MAG TPA: pteridine reductase [Steroidobacteraceae bacterium]|nr:pteridine reductase [Steroidobacteraceae bacterium]
MNPAVPLSGKCVLVTGAARRIGAAIVQAMHAAGANVVIHHRGSAAEAAALGAALNEQRPRSALTVHAELTDLKALPQLVERARSAFGRLDVLVNNASSFYPTRVGQITPQQWDDLIGSNLRAPLFLSQLAAPELKRNHGLIINLIDIHALRPLRHHTVYSVAKAGLATLTRSLARELAPEVRVNGIAPGPVLWPDADIEPEVKQEIMERTALKRMGTPEDVARAAIFFAQDAPYVTGQILAVDGGRSVGW